MAPEAGPWEGGGQGCGPSGWAQRGWRTEPPPPPAALLLSPPTHTGALVQVQPSTRGAPPDTTHAVVFTLDLPASRMEKRISAAC